MSTRERISKRFSVGSLVRVKKGVTAPNNPELPLGGWLGTIAQVSGTLCLVHWSGATLETVRPMLYHGCEKNGVGLRTMWLQETALEGDPGEPLCIELESRFGVERR